MNKINDRIEAANDKFDSIAAEMIKSADNIEHLASLLTDRIRSDIAEHKDGFNHALVMNPANIADIINECSRLFELYSQLNYSRGYTQGLTTAQKIADKGV